MCRGLRKKSYLSYFISYCNYLKLIVVIYFNLNKNKIFFAEIINYINKEPPKRLYITIEVI